MMTPGLICPVCGYGAVSVSEREEPVIHVENGRRLGWFRVIRTFVHIDGSEHRVPVGMGKP